MEPIVWMFICQLVTIIISWFFHKWVIETTGIGKLIYIVLTVIVVIAIGIAFIVINNSSEQTSRVDVSPLAELNGEHLGYIEEAIEQLRSDPFNRTQGSMRSGHHIQWSDRQASFRLATVVHRDEAAAIETMERIRGLQGASMRHTHIVNDNNTEALLFYIFTDNPYLIPSSRREIWSEIRIGHVVFTLRERRQANDLNNNISSEFIETIVGILSRLEEGIETQGHPLVGRWLWNPLENSSHQQYVFYGTGEGSRLDALSREFFTWTSNGDGELTVELDVAEGEQSVEVWRYTVDDRELVLECLQNNTNASYRRQ